MSQIAFPYLLCMSLVALLSGVLNSLGKFVESSAVSIVLNLTLMAAMLLALALGYGNDRTAGLVQAWGIFAAGILQLMLLVDGVRRNGMLLRLRRPRMTEGVRRLVTLGIPGVIAGGVTQINIVIGGMIASFQQGAVSYLYYADRLYELPLAIIGIAIGVVLLPDVSRHLRAGDHVAVMDSQNRSLEFAMLLTVPAAVALAVVPHQIVSVLFERGAFHAADTPQRRQRARHLRARAAVVRDDQGVLAGLFRARGHPHADALCRHQPDRQHGGLGRAVLPVPAARLDAAPRHRRGHHARRLAQCRAALSHARQARPFRRRRAPAADAADDPAGERDHGRCAVAGRGLARARG